VASTTTAAARPSPITFRLSSFELTKLAKTSAMMAAAAVITRAVRPRPTPTAAAGSRPSFRASRIAPRRNTS
jgi:hypothetical protein